ncbi:MAG: 1,4-dihydroxy-2-naphthoate polyprenyltransferase [Bacteroidales bacterium]|nr:1,4-dihydroxy-2-naphthoate polyprenyltransferase [Bacteroidales bacterium]
MAHLKVWIHAFRLRTLPLALSSTFLGSMLALSGGNFKFSVFLLAAATTLFLQILSNLANDYGDTVHGADNEHRVGPERVTQSGQVTKPGMRRMIYIFIALSLISGSLLILKGTKNVGFYAILVFFILGFSAITAAIKYTVGKNPYGYLGFGDLFVFLFFGILGVAGTYYLHTNEFNPLILLPSSTIGLLSVGVLNLNNMRDIVNDTSSGKKTLVVRLGSKKAKIYHSLLLITSVALSVIYTLQNFKSYYQFAFLATLPLFYLNLKTVIQNTVPKDLNVELKKLALSTFLFSLTFGLGQIF